MRDSRLKLDITPDKSKLPGLTTEEAREDMVCPNGHPMRYELLPDWHVCAICEVAVGNEPGSGVHKIAPIPGQPGWWRWKKEPQ